LSILEQIWVRITLTSKSPEVVLEFSTDAVLNGVHQTMVGVRDTEESNLSKNVTNSQLKSVKDANSDLVGSRTLITQP
jgi:hypothetical protein